MGVAGQAARKPRHGWTSGRPGGLGPRGHRSPMSPADLTSCQQRNLATDSDCADLSRGSLYQAGDPRPRSAQSRGRHSADSLDHRHRVRCNCGDSDVVDMSSYRLLCERAQARTRRRKGNRGAHFGDTAQENESMTGRHAQRSDVVDTPRALERIGVVPTSAQRRIRDAFSG